MLGDTTLVSAVLADFESAPISEQHKALFRLISIAAVAAQNVTNEDVALARAAGWSDEALYDALTVCALFQFYNTWIDSTGVHDMPAEMYAVSGERLAQDGYAPKSPADAN
jgi:hypothetical protein